MPYSTPAQVRTVLQGYLESNQGDPDKTAANLSDAQIEYEISNADEQIDAVLRRRYALPLPEPTPAVLRNLSVDIAAAQADMLFRGSREYASALHPMRLRYERALLILDRIATGDYPLYNEGEGPDLVGDEAIVINPGFYDGGLITADQVFRNHTHRVHGAEYSEIEAIPYYPYLRPRT